MKIILLEKNLEDKYENFLLKHSESLVYYSIKFKEFLKEVLDCEEEYLLAIENNEIRGVLPLMKRRGKYGYVYNSLPFYGSNGGIIADNKEAFSYLINQYNNLIENSNIGSAVIISNPLYNREYYSSIRYDIIDERIGQFTELSFNNDAETELMSKIDSSARRNVKKAFKIGIKVEIDNTQFEFLKKTHYDNMKAINGKAKPQKFFNLVTKYFEEGKDYNLYVALLDGKPIAGLLLFYYNKIVEYYIPAIVQEFRSYQPLALIIYQAMVDAFKKGYDLWNWGGTWLTQEGVYRFKKKWGAKEIEYFYYIKINNKDIYTSTKEEIQKEYDNFFVIPFDKLKNG
ncbi:MAG: peptidoglycan bridge formation glycyltransferase FemA/FemB family protein [Candidatus Aenigmatarchaeota archaeon]